MKLAPPLALLGVLAGVGMPSHAQDFTIRTDVRLVEVYVTVFDRKGRQVDNLTQEQFQIREDGQPRDVVAFESRGMPLSCALLLDTTGSMARALPFLKTALLRFLDELGPRDAVAIYSFSNSLVQLQDFTTDKAAAKQSILRTRAFGRTALFDAIAQLAREISSRRGKKTIVVFTDGDDNSSVLNLTSATSRARKVGVPVYTVAQGEALSAKPLLEQLKRIAEVTGATTYRIKKPVQIGEVFREIAKQLAYTYMLAYKPAPKSDDAWRRIDVSVAGLKDYRLRAKQGYFPE